MNKAILFCTVLFIVPLLYQEVEGNILELNTGTIGGVEDRRLTDNNNDNICNWTTILREASTIISFGTYAQSQSLDCVRSVTELDISSIPTNAHISRITLSSDVFSLFDGETCDITNVNLPLTASNIDLINAIASGTLYFRSEADDCFQTDPPNEPFYAGFVDGTDEIFIIDSDSGHWNNNDIVADIQTAVTAGQDWFTLGYKTTAEVMHPTNQKTDSWSSATSCDPNPVSCIKVHIYWEIIPDAVDTLFVTKFIIGGIDIEWEEVELNNGTFIGYQINLTTPHGDPLTPITNDTESTATVASILNLQGNTNYTFRVSAATNDGTGGFNGINASGFLLNTTTISLGNFTIGFASLDADNFDARDIKYRRLDMPDDITVLEVVYPNAFNLTCVMDYRFQNTNQTFSNLITVPESTDGGGLPSVAEQKATFTFVNASKEVIRVVCTDENTNSSAPFLLTVSQFPIINQLMDFRAGEFGTDGMLGAIDIITLGVVVMVMIGFNRWNESVGAILAVGLLGGLSFFQIVEWQTFMFGTFAVVIMVVVASTRKD